MAAGRQGKLSAAHLLLVGFFQPGSEVSSQTVLGPNGTSSRVLVAQVTHLRPGVRIPRPPMLRISREDNGLACTTSWRISWSLLGRPLGMI